MLYKSTFTYLRTYLQLIMLSFSDLFRCTANDLKMVARLIKHDLRISAGARDMYALHIVSHLFHTHSPVQYLRAPL